MAEKRIRPDHDGTHRGAFERNKKKIYATQTVCGICGQPVDFTIKYPHPLSACIDHIIPIVRGGHPSDIDNLQLAHFCSNGAMAYNLPGGVRPLGAAPHGPLANRVRPQSMNWAAYRSG